MTGSIVALLLRVCDFNDEIDDNLPPSWRAIRLFFVEDVNKRLTVNGGPYKQLIEYILWPLLEEIQTNGCYFQENNGTSTRQNFLDRYISPFLNR